MKDIVKTAIILSLIAIVAGVLLGAVNGLTYMTDEEKLNRNLNSAYESKDGYEAVDLTKYKAPEGSVAKLKSCYKAKGATDEVYIYSTNVKGYKKNLELMIVVKNNKIINIVKTASGETIAKPLSAENFSKYYDIDLTKTKGFHTNKQTADKDKTGVTVISGATLSSNGICNSIDLVVAYHNQIVGGKA